MRHFHGMEIPLKSQEEPSKKRKLGSCMLKQMGIMLPYSSMKKNGDIKRFKRHADNTQIVKLVYVHEGYTDSSMDRKKLKNVVYFGGLYRGKDNEKLWNEVKKYIEG